VAAELLLKKVVDINFQDQQEQTALNLAATRGQTRLVSLILETKGAEPDITDLRGWTPLWCATQAGHETIVKLLLEDKRINPNREKDSRTTLLRGTPLLISIWNGDAAITSLLLACSRTNPDISDANGRTPLSYAAEKGDATLVQQLLDT
ncbi:ankyrin, partial [Acephala macrosclerotiorum]